MLTVSGEADLTDGASRRSTVNVGIDGASTPLQAGDQVILIDAGTLTGTPANSVAGRLGATLDVEFDLTTSGNQLLATVKAQSGTPLREQTKALSEGYLAGLALVNQGSELIDWHGMQDAASGQGVFGKIAGGSLKYKTGSHIKMSSVSLMSGFAWNVNRLTLGAFFEYGNGDYDTHNAFRSSASIDGGGDTDYMGIGLAAKFRLTERVYLDGAIRAGKVDNDYNNTDLANLDRSRKATKLYTGLAWEHEFDGKARAATNGYAIDAPELKGSSAIGEAGVTIKAGKSVNVDLGLQGYAGKRRGVTGSANVRYAF